MESVLAYFCISYSVFPLPFIGGNLSPESFPVTIHWLRSVLKLRIDPNQLSLGSDTVSSLSLPPGNTTSEVSNAPKKKGRREF